MIPKILCVACVAASGVAAVSAPRAAFAARIAPAICTIDTVPSNYTLTRIEQRLDPADNTPETISYRTVNGLPGLTFSGITIVSDSASCAAALVGYSKLESPGDTVAQNSFLANVTSIYMVKLSLNRYVLNANIHDDEILVQHLLVDSTFALISGAF